MLSLGRYTVVTWMLVFGLTSMLHAQNPLNLRELDKVKSSYTATMVSSREAFAKAFEEKVTELEEKAAKEIVEPRKSNAEEELGEVKWEHQAYQETGIIPFSSEMRPAVVTMFQQQFEARKAVENFYSLRIQALTERKRRSEAERAKQDMVEFLKPEIVGVLECKGVNFRAEYLWTLYSNGKARYVDHDEATATWTFTSDNIVISNPSSRAPGGKWNDSGYASNSQHEIKFRNQGGGRYIARVAPELMEVRSEADLTRKPKPQLTPEEIAAQNEAAFNDKDKELVRAFAQERIKQIDGQIQQNRDLLRRKINMTLEYGPVKLQIDRLSAEKKVLQRPETYPPGTAMATHYQVLKHRVQRLKQTLEAGGGYIDIPTGSPDSGLQVRPDVDLSEGIDGIIGMMNMANREMDKANLRTHIEFYSEEMKYMEGLIKQMSPTARGVLKLN